jgi:hypothetical protein
MGRTVVGLLLAAALAAGCSRSNPTPTAAAPGPESAVGPSYSYEVRGEGAVSHGTASEPLSVSAGKNALTIKDGRLTVNGKDYGTVKSGDSIVVDRDGQVSINGAKREPH